MLLQSRDRQVVEHHSFCSLALAHRKVHLSLALVSCVNYRYQEDDRNLSIKNSFLRAKLQGKQIWQVHHVPFLGGFISPEKAALPSYGRLTGRRKYPFELLCPISQLPYVNTQVVIARSRGNRKRMPVVRKCIVRYQPT